MELLESREASTEHLSRIQTCLTLVPALYLIIKAAFALSQKKLGLWFQWPHKARRIESNAQDLSKMRGLIEDLLTTLT